MFWYLMTTVLRMFAKISENIREHSACDGESRWIWEDPARLHREQSWQYTICSWTGPLPGLGSHLAPSCAPVNLRLSWKEVHEVIISSKCKLGLHLKSSLIRGLFRLMNKSLLLLIFSSFKIVFTFDCAGSSLLWGLFLSCGEWAANCLVAGHKLLTAVMASPNVEYGLSGCSTQA